MRDPSPEKEKLFHKEGSSHKGGRTKSATFFPEGMAHREGTPFPQTSRRLPSGEKMALPAPCFPAGMEHTCCPCSGADSRRGNSAPDSPQQAMPAARNFMKKAFIINI
jgi:hypothetical protein